MSRHISCMASDILRPDLKPWSSCTNFVGGEVINVEGPPHTMTEWCDDDEIVRLIDTLDVDGCRHESVEISTKEER